MHAATVPRKQTFSKVSEMSNRKGFGLEVSTAVPKERQNQIEREQEYDQHYKSVRKQIVEKLKRTKRTVATIFGDERKSQWDILGEQGGRAATVRQLVRSEVSRQRRASGSRMPSKE